MKGKLGVSSKQEKIGQTMLDKLAIMDKQILLLDIVNTEIVIIMDKHFVVVMLDKQLIVVTPVKPFLEPMAINVKVTMDSIGQVMGATSRLMAPNPILQTQCLLIRNLIIDKERWVSVTV